MYRRWVSSYQFNWTPILTYTRRHLQLLDWFEQNVTPVAFYENHMNVGVAVLAEDLRVTVDRTGMRVESGLSGLPVDHLLPVLAGVFEVLEPREAILTSSGSTASFALPAETNYYEACARLASRTSGTRTLAAGFRALDASVLVDLQSPEESVQVEWGIVTDVELLTRIRNPLISRIHRTTNGADRDETHSHVDPPEAPPAVSVLTESYARRRLGGEVSNPTDVNNLIEEVNGTSEALTASIAGHFQDDEEGEW